MGAGPFFSNGPGPPHGQRTFRASARPARLGPLRGQRV